MPLHKSYSHTRLGFFDTKTNIIENENIDTLEDKIDTKAYVFPDTIVHSHNTADFPAEVTVAKVSLDLNQILVIMIHDISHGRKLNRKSCRTLRWHL